jgi:hypothetical protein
MVHCHPERSEGSPYTYRAILHFVQDDRVIFSAAERLTSVQPSTCESPEHRPQWVLYLLLLGVR